MFRRLNRFDRDVRERINQVANIAMRYGERGIVDWTVRAVADAQALGRLRDRDIENLDRIERTFDSDFYHSGNARSSDPIYA